MSLKIKILILVIFLLIIGGVYMLVSGSTQLYSPAPTEPGFSGDSTTTNENTKNAPEDTSSESTSETTATSQETIRISSTYRSAADDASGETSSESTDAALASSSVGTSTPTGADSASSSQSSRLSAEEEAAAKLALNTSEQGTVPSPSSPNSDTNTQPVPAEPETIVITEDNLPPTPGTTTEPLPPEDDQDCPPVDPTTAPLAPLVKYTTDNEFATPEQLAFLDNLTAVEDRSNQRATIIADDDDFSEPVPALTPTVLKDCLSAPEKPLTRAQQAQEKLRLSRLANANGNTTDDLAASSDDVTSESADARARAKLVSSKVPTPKPTQNAGLRGSGLNEASNAVAQNYETEDSAALSDTPAIENLFSGKATSAVVSPTIKGETGPEVLLYGLGLLVPLALQLKKRLK